MELDVPTLIFTMTLTTLAGGIALAAASRLHLPVRGIGLWSASQFLSSLGLALALTRTVAGPTVGIVVANTAILAGYLLLWLGARRLAGRRLRPMQVALPLGLTAVGLWLFMGDDGMAARVMIMSFMTSALLVLTAREFVRHEAPATNSRHVLAVLCAGHAIFYAARGAIAAVAPPSNSLFPAGVMGTVTFLEAFVWVILVTLGLVVLTSEVLHAELNRQATRDPLTDAYNRRAFTDMAERELARARRGRRAPAFLVLDLDHFKQLNDRHGHAAGDQVLQDFVRAVSACLRREDVLARFGGEEFVLMLPDSTAAEALTAAERIRLAATALAACDDDGQPIAVTVSIGIAPPPLHPGDDLAGVLRRADAALYRAKAAGRNRVMVADPLPAAASA
ncbi:GGDEF domain-containing protein [Caenispirillum bisanense]|uniref:GGDEF domain-containing protein n=1 Tax=Caenispirillum bisanense TaxID=414052 RepID=UPI0031D4ED3E